MTVRPSIDKTFTEMAFVLARRSTCIRTQQAAIIVRNRQLIAGGYNGSPPGMPHCLDLGCAREGARPMAKTELCRAFYLHGESNAIAQAARNGTSTDGAIMYTIYSPCKGCCNLVRVAGIKRLVYVYEYQGFREGPEYLNQLGIEVAQYEYYSGLVHARIGKGNFQDWNPRADLGEIPGV